jgi:hypothetical protein
MDAVVAMNDAEATRAADWVREQLRRPRSSAPPREIARQLGPDVLSVLRLLNAKPVEAR